MRDEFVSAPHTGCDSTVSAGNDGSTEIQIGPLTQTNRSRINSTWTSSEEKEGIGGAISPLSLEFMETGFSCVNFV